MRPFPAVFLAALAAAPRVSLAQDSVELARAGVPALSRPWTGADYRQLTAAIAEGKVPLPRLADPKGTAILRRAVDPGNVGVCRSSALAIQGRLAAYIDVMGGVPPLLNAYLATVGTKAVLPHEEMIRLMAYMLDLAALGVELLDELLPTIPRDEIYERRMEGLKQMRAGLTRVVMGAETSLGETSYTDADRSIMLAALEANLPKLRTMLAPDVVVDLRGKLERHRTRFQGDDRARLERSIELLVEQEKAQAARGLEKGAAVPAKP